MAMTRIRVGLLDSTRFMVGTLPVPKFTDQEKTQIATDRETGQPLYTVTVVGVQVDLQSHVQRDVQRRPYATGPGPSDNQPRHGAGHAVQGGA